MSELRAPVLESFLRQAKGLAIFPLVQVTCRPAVQMRSPERLQLCALGISYSRHGCTSCSTDFAVENQIRPLRPRTIVQSMDRYDASVISRIAPLLARTNSLLCSIGKVRSKVLIIISF